MCSLWPTTGQRKVKIVRARVMPLGRANCWHVQDLELDHRHPPLWTYPWQLGQKNWMLQRRLLYRIWPLLSSFCLTCVEPGFPTWCQDQLSQWSSGHWKADQCLLREDGISSFGRNSGRSKLFPLLPMWIVLEQKVPALENRVPDDIYNY